MKYKKAFLILLVLLLLPFALKLRGEDFELNQSPFTDISSRKSGGILAVLPQEQNRVCKELRIKTENTTKFLNKLEGKHRYLRLLPDSKYLSRLPDRFDDL